MKIVAIVGRSGTGKTSVEAELEKLGWNRVISYTDRQRREGEAENAYHFVTPEEFDRLSSDMIEVTIHEGTRRGCFRNDIKNPAVAVVNEEGALSFIETYPETQIILLVTDLAERRRRMRKRGDTEDSIISRENFEKDFSRELIEQSFMMIDTTHVPAHETAEYLHQRFYLSD